MAVSLISYALNSFWVWLIVERLGGCAGIITPQSHDRTDGVAIMTGATPSQLENALSTEGSVE